jgi:hypothetical protein
MNFGGARSEKLSLHLETVGDDGCDSIRHTANQETGRPSISRDFL